MYFDFRFAFAAARPCVRTSAPLWGARGRLQTGVAAGGRQIVPPYFYKAFSTATLGSRRGANNTCAHMSTDAHRRSRMCSPAPTSLRVATHLRTCAHMCQHVHRCPQTSSHVRTCAHKSTHGHTCPHMCSHVPACPQMPINVLECAHLCPQVHTWPHVSAHVFTGAHMSTDAHTRAHVCSPVPTSPHMPTHVRTFAHRSTRVDTCPHMHSHVPPHVHTCPCIFAQLLTCAHMSNTCPQIAADVLRGPRVSKLAPHGVHMFPHVQACPLMSTHCTGDSRVLFIRPLSLHCIRGQSMRLYRLLHDEPYVAVDNASYNSIHNARCMNNIIKLTLKLLLKLLIRDIKKEPYEAPSKAP